MPLLKIVFMGTPDFALPSLRIIHEAGYGIAAVITAPDKPAGRGLNLKQSPIKKYALEHGLRVLQPEKLKSPEFLEELKALHANLQIVVAFRMLPEVVWNMPTFGTFNLHASLLPQYRGAAPINWAIINGEKETGATTFFLQHEIDTGEIIFQETLPIATNETAGEIHDKLSLIGAELVLKTVKAIETGNAPFISQNATSTLKHAPKIFREDCRINWNKTALEIHNHIRGLSPFPGAWTMHEGKVVKIYGTKLATTNEQISTDFGLITQHENRLYVACKNALLEITELQTEGKKRMEVTAFLKGNELAGRFI